MNSLQYEELCRYFLAKKLGINADEIKSITIPNPTRPGLPEYKHQIDLYWETQDEIAKYLTIANAKWRRRDKVDQPEVLLLHQVKQKVGAHKAVMITTKGFTSGAIAAAKDEGIALHIFKPTLDVKLPTKVRTAIQAKLQELGKNLSLVEHTRKTTVIFEGKKKSGGGGSGESRGEKVYNAVYGIIAVIFCVIFYNDMGVLGIVAGLFWPIPVIIFLIGLIFG